ncbi:MAG: hypothetical protein BJ554DRAFT_7584 [Olpidium bornovanus]|uniref:Uncharacterized protein n=1 Tax=Olpidium bornovanus TaxID=278681 RepID=A0A8H7ZVG7_9FUNG|nr:MAG: hypothetical protein BJ554DRAFT_7584 [Olpidium bornovanus]
MTVRGRRGATAEGGNGGYGGRKRVGGTRRRKRRHGGGYGAASRGGRKRGRNGETRGVRRRLGREARGQARWQAGELGGLRAPGEGAVTGNGTAAAAAAGELFGADDVLDFTNKMADKDDAAAAAAATATTTVWRLPFSKLVHHPTRDILFLACGGHLHTIDTTKNGLVCRTTAGPNPDTPHTGIIRTLAISNDGRRLVSSGEDKLLKVWSTERELECLSSR